MGDMNNISPRISILVLVRPIASAGYKQENAAFTRRASVVSAFIGFGLKDCYRKLYPQSTELFSWFDYRSRVLKIRPNAGCVSTIYWPALRFMIIVWMQVLLTMCAAWKNLPTTPLSGQNLSNLKGYLTRTSPLMPASKCPGIKQAKSSVPLFELPYNLTLLACL